MNVKNEAVLNYQLFLEDEDDFINADNSNRTSLAIIKKKEPYIMKTRPIS